MHSEIDKLAVHSCYATLVVGTLMLNLTENEYAMGNK